MYRLLSMSLLAIGLLAAYSFRAPQAAAAPSSSFPYGPGDSVRLEYADGANRTCVVERFYGDFLSCKVISGAFAAPDAPPAALYNTATVRSIHLVKKAE
jgi:hypothetical protein